MTEPKLGIVIQARVNSSRFPRKVLHNFYDAKNLLDIIVNKIKKVGYLTETVVATTSNPLDDELVEYCSKIGVQCFRGSEQNVLLRFKQAAEYNQFTNVIRVCADNPFLSTKALIDLANPIWLEYDYVAYKINGSLPAIQSHLGFWPELISVSTLQRIIELTHEGLFLEHVTNFVYSNPNYFNIKWLDISIEKSKIKAIRLTLDTITDFKVLDQLKRELDLNMIEDYTEILQYVWKQKNLLELMKWNISQNAK